jgi:predicted PurR-regulated permease PerM
MSQTSELREEEQKESPELLIPAPEQVAEPAEILHASLRVGSVAQVVVAVIATIGLIYLLKLVLVTTLTALLFAYVLEPPVAWLALLRIPRWLGSAIVVSLTLLSALGLLYFSYNSAEAFADQLPQYSATFRDELGNLRSGAARIENQARSIVESPKSPGKQPIAVRVEEPQGLAHMITENSGTILDLMLAAGFVPFLVYFMLVSKDHFHVMTVRFFPTEHRLLAHRTIGTISSMIRSYIVANVALGMANATILALVFWYLGIKYSYFIGAISGFLSLIPYLGVFVSLLPPLAGGLGVLGKTGLITVFAAVIGLHLVTMNLFYPKVVGGRLKLNPLAVSLSLLFWAWLWGSWGLILAIPILGAAKIICDHFDPLLQLGAWLGESENSSLP